MKYNSFTQKRKIPIAELNNQSQANKISLQSWVESQVISRVQNTQPRNQSINVASNWDSDWETMDSIMSGTTVLAIYKTWDILLGDINYNLLNKFSVDMVFRNGVLGDGDSAGFQVSTNIYFKKFIGWDVKDLIATPASDIKTIRIIASLFTYTPGVLPIFQSKLLVKYLDQTNRD
jgi:hypothetical protein